MQPIKSFVLRAGRMSPRQKLAYEQWLPQYQLPLDGHYWDIAQCFGREADTIVEIGFGMGASLLAMAKNHPQWNFIGIEVHRAGLGSLAADLHEEGITNVRIAPFDAVEVFKQQIIPNTLAGVQIFFPDPWHKKRHNKRRLIQPALVESLTASLKPGGFIHCATDWEDYAHQMQVVLSAELQLENSQPEGGFSPKPDSRPTTKFEARGTRLGHRVWDLIYLKKVLSEKLS